MDNKYTIDVIRRDLSLMAYHCPLGVDKNILPTILRTCPSEYITANVVVYPVNNEIVAKSPMTNPIIEQSRYPIILVLRDIDGQQPFSVEGNENVFSDDYLTYYLYVLFPIYS